MGREVLIVGRQVPTPSGPLDLLALDDENHLVVIENKRDMTAREAIAQILDYTSWARSLTLEDVEEVYSTYYKPTSEDDESDLSTAYKERFESDLDSLDTPPQMVVVASRLDDATERMIEFLAEEFDVPINAVLFQAFNVDQHAVGTIIGRTQLRPEDTSSSKPRSKKSKDRQEFWKRWFSHARSTLPELRLRNVGTSPYISRKVEPGIPASILVWIATSTAFSQLRFDDMTNPEQNTLMFERMVERKDTIEECYGSELTWENHPNYASASISTSKVDIGSLVDPTEDGLGNLTEATRRLLDAVVPHLRDAHGEATDLPVRAEMDDEEHE